MFARFCWKMPPLLALLVAAFWSVCGVAAAAPLGLKNGEPIEITSAALDVSQNQSHAVFKGSVKVVQGPMTLTTDMLTVDYTAKGGKAGKGASGIDKLVATGHVKIDRDNGAEVATGDAATYTPDTQLLVLTGTTVTLTRGINTLEGDKLVYAVATGNAKVTNSKGPVKARFVPGSAQ